MSVQTFGQEPPEKIKEMLRKVLALAERGMAGEAKAAQAALKRLLAKYNLTMEDIASEKKSFYIFKLRTAVDRKLFAQVLVAILRTRNIRHIPGARVWRVELTSLQHVEVRRSFEYYQQALTRESDLLFIAFCCKHSLSGPKDGEDATPMDPAEFEAIMAMMSGLREPHLRKQLAEARQ